MAIENLDEMERRRTRQASVTTWTPNNLENPSTYEWQPETLCYYDSLSGKEVWVLARTPNRGSYVSDDIQTIYGTDYNHQAWSYRGEWVGFWVKRTGRATNNSSVPATSYGRWLVHATGRYLKASTGRANNTRPEGGFGWANTENAFYGFGSGTSEPGYSTATLVKNVVSSIGVVTPSAILDTYSATGGDQTKGWATSEKALIKRAISYDDEWLTVYSLSIIDRGKLINTEAVMRINLNQGSSPTITHYWPLSRGCPEYNDHWNPATSTWPDWSSETTYSKGDRIKYSSYYYSSKQDSNLNHAPVPGGDSYWAPLNPISEQKQHGGGFWAWGIANEYIELLYSGDHIYWRMKVAGTDTDTGPKVEAWNESSYGGDEVYPVAGADYRSPQTYPYSPDPSTYNFGYFNHPAWDRWYANVMSGANEESGQTKGTGTAIWKSPTLGWDDTTGPDRGNISSDIHTGYMPDGYHRTWDGWCDTVLWTPYYIGATIYNGRVIVAKNLNFTTKLAGSYYIVCDTHYHYGTPIGNYSAYPRLVQSPDGTKVLFHTEFLNGASDTDDRFPYICYAQVYAPKPPTTLAATDTANGVSLSWAAPKYTTRGFPTGEDPVPSAMEIKGYHVWMSLNGTTGWTEVTTAEVASPLAITQADNTTRYYAVTSEEYSGMESDILSEVIRCVIDEYGDLTTSITAAEGTTEWWTSSPTNATNFGGSKDETTGHYLLSWTGSSDSKVRYYNLYYSDTAVPSAVQQNRIASIRVGVNAYRDWNPNTSSEYAYYALTAVDRYGNESTAATWSMGETPLGDKVLVGFTA